MGSTISAPTSSVEQRAEVRIGTMAKKGILGVLFDWDGVLLDSLGATMNAYNRIISKMGMVPLSREKFLELQSPNWYEFYSKLGIPKVKWKKMDDDWMRLYKEEEPSLHPDAIDCLAALKKSGFRLALVSNGNKDRVGEELGRFALRSFFDAVCCGERKEELKPSPVLLKRALRELDLQSRSAVYVGDSPADLQASENAGTLSVALARGPIQEKRLQRQKPDYLFRNLEEVTGFLVDRD
jgi:HAD superfamily hydrolase (TIGR01509 family)